MRLPRRIITLVVIVGTVWLSLCSLIGTIAVKAALHPARLPIDEAENNSARNIAARDHASLSDVSITAADGALLRAWVIALPRGNGDVVILLHGQGDNRAGMLGTADMLLRHGYSILLPDSRAHGQSGGRIAGYGVKEVDDVLRWFNFLHRSISPHCIDGLGDSMGAAILLQSLTIEPHFCAVVAESSFASFREASYDRLGQWFGTGPWLGRTVLQPAVEAGFLYADLCCGVDLELASPAEAVADTHVPVLLIHGLVDTNLPARHSERIRARNRLVALWEPPHAEHCGAFAADPEEYESKVVGWFDGHRAVGNLARKESPLLR